VSERRVELIMHQVGAERIHRRERFRENRAGRIVLFYRVPDPFAHFKTALPEGETGTFIFERLHFPAGHGERFPVKFRGQPFRNPVFRGKILFSPVRLAAPRLVDAETVESVLLHIEFGDAGNVVLVFRLFVIVGIPSEDLSLPGKRDPAGGCSPLHDFREHSAVGNQIHPHFHPVAVCIFDKGPQIAGCSGVTVDFEKMTRIPTEVDVASEFRYRDPILSKNTLVIIISQSGETADTLAALRLAKEKGARVLSIVNVVGSTIANESDSVIYTAAGPEIAVATTKAFSAQVAVLYLLSALIASEKGLFSKEELALYLGELLSVPQKIKETIDTTKERAKEIGKEFSVLEHSYFIGRGIDFAAATEGSLKLKEISYIHSEAYAAGELKHGTISLIENGTAVIALACDDRLFSKTMSNIKEVVSRGAKVLVVTTEKHKADCAGLDFVVTVSQTNPLFSASLEIVFLQLLSFYTALSRGCDIDKPRNLAKSVTVE